MRKFLFGLGTVGLLFSAWKMASPKNGRQSVLNEPSSDRTIRKKARNRTLLTVSGTISENIEEEIAQKKRPYADYMAMADRFGAELLDYRDTQRQSSWFGRLLEKVGGSNLSMAWYCFSKRHEYDVIFTDGEQIGMPLALLSKYLGLGGGGARHLMIVHILSVGKKTLFFDLFGIQSHIDTFFVYSTWQKQFIEERWNVPAERVVFTPFMVDSHFFASDQVIAHDSALSNELLIGKPMSCSVGLEFRDYPTLMKAVKGLDLQVVVAAGSPWSKRKDSTEGTDIPENVVVRRFTQYDLRQVYADSAFMVMPLYNVNFQAGVTAILEAMSMSKAVICSQTPGQTDVVIEGETGLYVPPDDPKALRKAIQHLLDHPEEAARMGRNGRKRIEEYMSLDRYVERLERYVDDA